MLRHVLRSGNFASRYHERFRKKVKVWVVSQELLYGQREVVLSGQVELSWKLVQLLSRLQTLEQQGSGAGSSPVKRELLLAGRFFVVVLLERLVDHL